MAKLHFAIEGEFITQLAREKLFQEKDLAGAIRILRSATCSNDVDSDDQLMLCLMVLNGDAGIKGRSDSDDYGLKFRDDIDENPTELSSIAKLILDMKEEIEDLKEQESRMSAKFGFLAGQLEDYRLRQVNEDYYKEYGEPMFSDIAVPAYVVDGCAPNRLLDDYMEQRRREDASEEEVEDYGWLEPDGTWHPVPWGDHAKWANEWLMENRPMEDYKGIYRKGQKPISGGDVLVMSLGWILMDSPHHGLARPTIADDRVMTKAQRDFLYGYYIDRGRHDEANALFPD